MVYVKHEEQDSKPSVKVQEKVVLVVPMEKAVVVVIEITTGLLVKKIAKRIEDSAESNLAVMVLVDLVTEISKDGIVVETMGKKPI